MQRPSRQNAIYWALLAASFAMALTASWTSFGAQIDNDAYDWMFRLYQPPTWQPESILLVIDEVSLNAYGGLPGLRKPLAEALRLIAAVSPKTVAGELILTDKIDPAIDARLEEALRATRNLVLACQLLPDSAAWEDPLPRFRAQATALGHVHAEPDELDSVGRSLPLEKVANRDRRWALSLEAYRLSRGGGPNVQIVESPTDLDIGGGGVPPPPARGRPLRPCSSAPFAHLSRYRGARDPLHARWRTPHAHSLRAALHAHSAHFAPGAAQRSPPRLRVLRQGRIRRRDRAERGQGLDVYSLLHARADGGRRNPC